MKQRYPGVTHNALRANGGSLVRAMEPEIVEELDLEEGDAPDEIQWDAEEREITLSF